MKQITTDAGRWYEKDGIKYYSVSTIIKKTTPESDTFYLRRWAERIGQEEADRIRNEAAELGTELHKLLEMYLLDKDPVEVKNTKAILLFDNYREGYLEQFTVKPLHTEVMVHNSIGDWHYAGTVDLIADENNEVTLVDHKTIKKLSGAKQRLPGYGMQLAGYKDAAEKNLGITISKMRINFVSDEGFKTFILDFEEYWPLWLQRLEQFYTEGHHEHIQASQGESNNNADSITDSGS